MRYAQALRDIADSDALHGSPYALSLQKIADALDNSIVLPLDPAQIDDAAVEVMAKAAFYECTAPHMIDWLETSDVERDMYRDEVRAALAALLAHLAEVDRG